MSSGFSMTDLSVSRNSAARWSSMTRESHAVVIDNMVAVVTELRGWSVAMVTELLGWSVAMVTELLGWSPPLRGWSVGVRTGRAAPTASIQVCGGLMTAENDEIPNIPRLEILQQQHNINDLPVKLKKSTLFLKKTHQL